MERSAVRFVSSTEPLVAHRLAGLLPDMSGADYDTLLKSVQKIGFVEPIWLLDGKILDGRHRFSVAKELGVEIPVVDVTVTREEAIDFVEAQGLARRNLTKSQRAAVAVSLMEELAKKAKNRKAAGTKADPEEKGSAAAAAGKAVGVSASYVKYAQSIIENYPEIADRIMSGEINISQAKKEIDEAKAIAERESAVLVDDLQQEVPKHLRDVWFEASVIDEAAKNVSAVGRQAKTIADADVYTTGVGAALPEDDIAAQVRKLRSLIAGARPSVVVSHSVVSSLPNIEFPRELREREWLSVAEYKLLQKLNTEASGGEGVEEVSEEDEAPKKTKTKTKAKAK
jgi:hypothetical protein